MCEIEKQMQELLKGSKPTLATKAINIMAMDLDKKFDKIDDKLEKIIYIVKEYKISTDDAIKQMSSDRDVNCKLHKEEINDKLKEVEVLAFLSKHPSILKMVGVSLLILIAYNVYTLVKPFIEMS